MRHFLLLPLLLCSGCRATTKHADIIYTNARIWTGNPEQPMAEALAVSAERIVVVGRTTEVEKWKGPQTRVMNLEGRFVVPGFIDNHTHFLQGGSQLASVNLRVAGTAAEFVQIIKSFAATMDNDSWINGGDWDHEAWGGELPRREWIDSISGEHPVFVSRLDGHMALANSKTLSLAGITANTPNPQRDRMVMSVIPS